MVTKSIEKNHVQITLATLVTLIIFIIGIVATASDWKNDVDNELERLDDRADHLVNGFNAVKEDIEQVEQRQQVINVDIAKIETRLAFIEATLVEIKNAVVE